MNFWGTGKNNIFASRATVNVSKQSNICENWIQLRKYITGVRACEVTVIPSILSQIIVVPSTFSMKLRIFISVMWFNYQIPIKIYLDYRIIYQKYQIRAPEKIPNTLQLRNYFFVAVKQKTIIWQSQRVHSKFQITVYQQGLKPWYQLSLIKTRTNFPGLLLLSRTRHFVSISSLLLPHWQVSCLPGCRYLRHEVSREDSKHVFVYVVSNKIFQIIKTFEGVSFERTTKPSYRQIIQTSRCSCF